MWPAAALDDPRGARPVARWGGRVVRLHARAATGARVGERLVAWSRAVARAQSEGGSPDRGQRSGFMRDAAEGGARLERAASCEQALDVVTDDIPASMDAHRDETRAHRG